MKGQSDLSSEIPFKPAEPSRSPGRRRLLLVCLAGWTALVIGGTWWLLHNDSSPSIVIFHEGETSSANEKFRAWFKADSGLQRIYPWILFGPYAALVAWWFPLERGRLLLSLPLNLAACTAFIAASNALNARLGGGGAKLTIITSEHQTRLPGDGTGTNKTYVKIIRSEAPNLLEQGPVHQFSDKADTWSGLPAQLSPDFLNSSPSNVLVSAGGLPWNPHMGLPGPPRLPVLSLFMDLLAYSAILGLAHSVHFYRRFREREHRTLVLESGLANARLSALRAQLQPHFLFNSLNAIAALLRRDPRLAEATLVSLSDLLRLALSQSEKQEVALRDELNLVQRYLEIQQTRFGDKLQVEQNIEPPTLDCLVPTLVLQPLVENAIRHGLEPAENGGLVRLSAHRNSERLILTVEDDGVGLAKTTGGVVDRGLASPLPKPGEVESTPDERINGSGIGLKNLQARLQTLYGENQKFELSPRPAGGALVRVEIPWRTSPQPEETPVRMPS